MSMEKMKLHEIIMKYSHLFDDVVQQIEMLKDARVEGEYVYLPQWVVRLLEESGKKSVPLTRTKKQYGATWGREVIALYNEMLGEVLPRVTVLSPQRLSFISARTRERLKTLDDWREFFNVVLQSPFLLGQNNHGWRASFDWLVRPNNFAKVIDGVYSRPQARQQQAQRSSEQSKMYTIMKYLYELYRTPQSSPVLQHHPLRNKVYRAMQCIARGENAYDNDLRDLLEDKYFVKIARKVIDAAKEEAVGVQMVEMEDGEGQRGDMERMYSLVAAMVRPHS